MIENQKGEEKVKQAKRYQRTRQKLTLFHLVFTPALLGFVGISPLSAIMKSWAASLTSNGYAEVAWYFLFFSLLMLIFDLPLAFYSGYLLEHRFQLSDQTLGSWAVELTKQSLLSFGISLALISALYALIWRFEISWWLWAWGGFIFFSYVMGKIFPVLIVPLFYRYSRVEDQALRDRILKLAARFGLPIENIYSLNLSKTTKKANAAFMGIGKTKRVILGDTLLNHFSPEEIEVVLAHELGHYKHRDIWKQLGFGALTSLVAFWIASRVMDPLAHWRGYEGVQDVAGLPLLFLVFKVFHLVLMPLQNGFSRRVERAADQFALEAYERPEPFISAMAKLGESNLSDPYPHPLYEWFFYTHPSIGKRIQMAKNWKAAA